MKKTVLFLFLTFLVSCTNSKNGDSSKEYQELLSEKNKLINENKKLIDSIHEIEKEFLYSQILIGVPDESILKAGKENNIAMIFQTHLKKIPEYQIFRIEGNKKIKIGSNNQTRFDYKFIPKSKEDNELELLVKMPYDGKVIEIPAKMYFDIK